MEPQKTIYTITEAAAYLGVSKKTMYTLTHQRRITFSKPGGKKVYFTKESLDAYAAKNTFAAK